MDGLDTSLDAEPPLRTEGYALVGRSGSIDWLCWPRYDSDACCAALLGMSRDRRSLLAPADRTATVNLPDGTENKPNDSGLASVIFDMTLFETMALTETKWRGSRRVWVSITAEGRQRSLSNASKMAPASTKP